MTVITYGTSVKESAKSRRHARRRAVAIERDALNAIIDAALNVEPAIEVAEARKRPATDRVAKAVDTETQYHRQILAAAEKYVEYRASSKFQQVCNEAGRQIHAVQKRRGKSIPLIPFSA